MDKHTKNKINGTMASTITSNSPSKLSIKNLQRAVRHRYVLSKVNFTRKGGTLKTLKFSKKKRVGLFYRVFNKLNKPSKVFIKLHKSISRASLILSKFDKHAIKVNTTNRRVLYLKIKKLLRRRVIYSKSHVYVLYTRSVGRITKKVILTTKRYYPTSPLSKFSQLGRLRMSKLKLFKLLKVGRIDNTQSYVLYPADTTRDIKLNTTSAHTVNNLKPKPKVFNNNRTLPDIKSTKSLRCGW